MRLDKFLSNTLNISRSNVPLFIKKNEVLVNGKKTIKKDYSINESTDVILVNGEKVIYKRFVYYMLNKPAGVVSATIDNLDQTVVSLIDTKEEIFSIGRLDKDTVGLLILTNDGKISHFLTSPTHHVIKKYYVEIDSDLTDEEMNAFSNGIKIKDGDENEFITKQAIIAKIEPLKYYVSISEGKFHQIKRMFWYFKKDVTYLKRVSFGDIKLDESLSEGKYRELTEKEVEILTKDFK